MILIFFFIIYFLFFFLFGIRPLNRKSDGLEIFFVFFKKKNKCFVCWNFFFIF